MPGLIKSALKFAGALFVTSVVCSVAWQETAADLYDCTDDFLPGYFEFGWVRNQPNRPVKTVGRIVHGRSMSEPDTIREGWSTTKLWRLWFVFFGALLVVSATAAGVPWTLPAWSRRVWTMREP